MTIKEKLREKKLVYRKSERSKEKVEERTTKKARKPIEDFIIPNFVQMDEENKTAERMEITFLVYNGKLPVPTAVEFDTIGKDNRDRKTIRKLTFRYRNKEVLRKAVGMSRDYEMQTGICYSTMEELIKYRFFMKTSQKEEAS